MIYYALSLLSGILWVHLRIFSIFIISIIILVCVQKRFKLFSISMLLLTFIAGILLIQYNDKMNDFRVNYFQNHNLINGQVQFSGQIKQIGQQLKGDFNYKGETYHFNLIAKSISSSTLENKSCMIKGKVTNMINQNIYVTINNIFSNTCKNNNRISFIDLHLKYINNKLHQTSLEHPERIIALITGEMSDINPDYLDDVKSIGIYHLLAVSGSHIATISFLIYQSLVRFNIPKILINILIIISLIIFAFYSGLAPSALRAILSTIIILILTNTKKTLIDVLGLVFIIMVIFSSNLIYDIGFQFSFLISLFIILILPLLNKRSSIQNLLLITLVAQLSSSLISIYHFNQLQWLGLFTNMIYVPFYGFVLFPLAIMTFMIYHFFNNINILNAIVNEVFELHDKLLNFFLHFKFYQVFIYPHSSLELFLYFFLFFLLYFLISHKKVILTCIIIITLIILILVGTSPQSTTITFLDVGQGDSLVFQTKQKETVMVDTGGKKTLYGKYNNHSISKYHILPTLRRKGISTIDYLIITHPHADHMGELSYIVNQIKIKTIYINLPSFTEKELTNIQIMCKKYNIELFDASEINDLSLKSSKIRFLHSYIPTSEDKNEQSLIILINYKTYHLLLMGDATKNNEALLIKKIRVAQN